MKYFTIITTLILWVAIFLMIVFIDPFTFGAIYFFYALVLVTILFTLTNFSQKVKQNLLIAAGITLFVVLRANGLGNILNLILLIGGVVAIEYFSG